MTNQMTNPYLAPKASLAQENHAPVYELARLPIRLAAALIDCLLYFALLTVVAYLTTRYVPHLFEKIKERHIPLALVGFVYVCLFFLLLNGKFLSENGQTVGKLICSIRIVRKDGRAVGLWYIFLRRSIPIFLLGMIPTIGIALQLIEVLFGLRISRQCLHDLLADTVVVYAVDKNR